MASRNTEPTRAWSTIRKVASDSGYAARQTTCDSRTCYVLIDPRQNVVLCTRNGQELENAVYSI